MKDYIGKQVSRIMKISSEYRPEYTAEAQGGSFSYAIVWGGSKSGGSGGTTDSSNQICKAGNSQGCTR